MCICQNILCDDFGWFSPGHARPRSDDSLHQIGCATDIQQTRPIDSEVRICRSFGVTLLYSLKLE